MAAALAVSAACSVTLISHYDEQIDRAATELQRRMDAHLTKLEQRPDAATVAFAGNRQFYEDYAVDLRAVRLRAATHPKNATSLAQYDLMLNSLEDLRATHESETIVSPGFARQVRELFNQAWQAIITLEVAKKRGETE